MATNNIQKGIISYSVRKALIQQAQEANALRTRGFQVVGRTTHIPVAQPDNNDPSGIQPHAGQSWQAKYEYMNTLWLKQKDEITSLQAEKQRREEEIQLLLNREIARLEAELAKKDEKIAYLEAESVKSPLANPEVTVPEKTKTEVSISKQFIASLTILVISIVLILIMRKLSQKISLPLVPMIQSP